MSKALKVTAALGVGLGALISEFVLHGYLDIMYKETIPPSLVKRLANKYGSAGMDDFEKYTSESCKWIEQQNTEIISLKSQFGYLLKGYLLPAQEQSNVFVLFAHGYRSDHLGDPANFERYYHEKGYNFISVDHTASGESEGDWVGFDYFESQDMLSWIDYLAERFGDHIKIILHGVSMGGATVCQMASRVQPQVKLIISDCAYTSACDQFIKVANHAGVKKTAPFVLRIMNVMNKKFAGYDLKQTDVRQSVADSKVPMLFVHGGSDDFVPVEMCYELYDLCSREKDILIVREAHHAQSIMADSDLYKSKIDEFTEKYL